MQTYFGMQTCSSPRVPAVPKGNCMEWRLWNGPICVLEPILKWAYPRYYMGKMWRILQTTIQQSLGQIWLTDEFQTRKLQCGWMVQCHAGTSELGQISPRDSQNTPQGHLLFFFERWRFCAQDHQWWQCQLGQIPCKQSAPIGQKI